MKQITDFQKPARYVGGEYGIAEMKPNAYRFCLCFPDVYEVGMSNLGTRILYYTVNEGDVANCERCYTPWPDYGNELRATGTPLVSLETKTPLKNFDAVGFSLQYELSYSNVLYMLDLAQIPLLAKDRSEKDPFIIFGGPCCVNVEPMADFADIVQIGEGEQMLPELLRLLNDSKGMPKAQVLQKAMEIEGIYIPSLQKPKYENGRIVGFTGGKRVKRRFVRSLEDTYFPRKAPVPNVEIVHDRAVAEIYRGCANGCRFCQAGFLYRPVRERSVSKLCDICRDLADFTGFDEISLNSLSTGDYSGLKELLAELKPYLKERHVQLALPSLRVDSFDRDFAQNNRKTGSLTFAPEAGTQRLRNVINKNVTEENIMQTLGQAFEDGYATVKLYFMLGLPTETTEDVLEIANLVQKIRSLFYQKRSSKKDLRLNVSVATFIPKPFTPFQWEAFDSFQHVEEKQALLREKLKGRNFSFSYHDYDSSVMEAVFARGDRRLSSVLLGAYRKGSLFDGWSEYFKAENYYEAARECGVDLNDYLRARSQEEILPWDCIDIGVTRAFLWNERAKSREAITTPGCNKRCSACGLEKEGVCHR